ncbi:MAG: hypothetical protein LBP59_10390 [Planctomycetaceae bacterium]|nr:hypothetical protein [Planctomycetaceae bacterium]
MGNQNIADISMFESLQANQHERMGISQIGVFNGTAELARFRVAMADYEISKQKLNELQEQRRKLPIDKDNLQKQILTIKSQRTKELLELQKQANMLTKQKDEIAKKYNEVDAFYYKQLNLLDDDYIKVRAIDENIMIEKGVLAKKLKTLELAMKVEYAALSKNNKSADFAEIDEIIQLSDRVTESAQLQQLSKRLEVLRKM